MASVVGFSSRNFINSIIRSRRSNIYLRCISTAKKNSHEENLQKLDFTNTPDFSKPLENKNWVSFGFDFDDEKEDKLNMNTLGFVGITLMFVFGVMFVAYWPDFEHRNWAKREAFIRLHERERLGLDPIDKNYIDPSKIVLPSDEELGDTEIII